jgi:restriction endonuclease S subunit
MEKIIKEYKDKIQHHQEEIKRLENELQNYIKEHSADIVKYLMNEEDEEKIEKEYKPEKMRIVSVCFNKKTGKTYDYQYLSNGEIKKGDTVFVNSSWQGVMELEVIDTFEIDEKDAEYDYQPAFKSEEDMEDYWN